MLLEELHSPTGKTYLEISRREGEQWLHVDWLGYPTAANVSTGGIAYLDWLRQLKLHGVLNDNRHLVGRWDSSLEWLQNTWLPYALQSGLRYWAYLSPAGTMAAGSATSMRKLLGEKLEIGLFSNEAEAISWLRAKVLGS